MKLQLVLLGLWVGCAVAQVMYPVMVGNAGSTVDNNVIYGSDNPAWYLNAFFPPKLTINVGDSVNFYWGSFLMTHSVTHDPTQHCAANPEACAAPSGNPANFTGQFMNSGFSPLLVKYPYGYNVTFMMSGNFTFSCAVHPFQVFMVTVNPMGSTYPMSISDVKTAAAGQLTANLNALTAFSSATAAMETAHPITMGANKLYTMTGGFDIPDPTSPAFGSCNLRYYPFNMTIMEGDTVSFVSSYLEPHAMAFNGSTLVDIDYGTPGYFTAPMLGPTILPVSTGGRVAVVYDGSMFLQSSLIFGMANPGANSPGALTMMNITFTKAGRYPFLCAIHSDNGMSGVINVMPGSGSGSSSSTGTTGGGGAASMLTPSMALLALLSFAVYFFHV